MNDGSVGFCSHCVIYASDYLIIDPSALLQSFLYWFFHQDENNDESFFLKST